MGMRVQLEINNVKLDAARTQEVIEAFKRHAGPDDNITDLESLCEVNDFDATRDGNTITVDCWQGEKWLDDIHSFCLAITPAVLPTDKATPWLHAQIILTDEYGDAWGYRYRDCKCIELTFVPEEGDELVVPRSIDPVAIT